MLHKAGVVFAGTPQKPSEWFNLELLGCRAEPEHEGGLRTYAPAMVTNRALIPRNENLGNGIYQLLQSHSPPVAAHQSPELDELPAAPSPGCSPVLSPISCPSPDELHKTQRLWAELQELPSQADFRAGGAASNDGAQAMLDKLSASEVSWSEEIRFVTDRILRSRHQSECIHSLLRRPRAY
eukprot:TRINITY_DN16822_c0_g1_i1.p1 TRINITY_DN16822_c0_g1~~TRINITY_DN16822_c0_g1_i1.p1  ORF type:complete len:182 (-),score=20.78 TRINITY_DN16822_c0_g1_i1:137-682(-)